MSDEATAGVALEDRFVARIASDVGCRPRQVAAAAALFADGATVPFVARYRKEATGGLNDAMLETIARGREYFLELTLRRDAILGILAKLGKLGPDLESAIRAALTKHELEDLYLPHRPKRRTRAGLARERGLAPLAQALVEGARDPSASPEALASPFVDSEKGVSDAAAALAGARDILAEQLAETASNRVRLRAALTRDGQLRTKVVPGKETEGAVYRDYFDHGELARRMPSHRYLAVVRGERAHVLAVDLEIDDTAEIQRVASSLGVPTDTPCGRDIVVAADDGYRRLLRPSLTNEVRGELKRVAEADAMGVFRANLEALLLQSPFGRRPVLGLDPGHRTGCKLAVVDGTGRVLETGVIRPIAPDADEAGAAAKIQQMIRAHGIAAIAVGNGTGGRETEIFARKAVRETAAGDESPIVAIVPETGASVYSASATARAELKDLDVALRGAVSIARRLQDPLAELVKIEPRSLGVGQYQHDVDQKALGRELDAAVESVVNGVGVELNSASPALLSRVSGLSEKLARAIVARRDETGAYAGRHELLAVPGLGPKTFELAAGFLRIRGAANPLDATAVHPERYPLVEAMAAALGTPLAELVGNTSSVARLDLRQFADESRGIGEFTLEDIAAELERPGRDPRPEFKVPAWRDDVQSLEDAQVGMDLEGRVSNVTNFGAFVDIGIKRDGLVHLSELSHRRLLDPRERVRVGDVVRVKVIEIDRERGRVSLSIKALEPAPEPRPRRPKREPKPAARRDPAGAPSGGEGRESRNPRPRPAPGGSRTPPDRPESDRAKTERPRTDRARPEKPSPDRPRPDRRPPQSGPRRERTSSGSDPSQPHQSGSKPPGNKPPDRRPQRDAPPERHYTLEDLAKRFKGNR